MKVLTSLETDIGLSVQLSYILPLNWKEPLFYLRLSLDEGGKETEPGLETSHFQDSYSERFFFPPPFDPRVSTADNLSTVRNIGIFIPTLEKKASQVLFPQIDFHQPWDRKPRKSRKIGLTQTHYTRNHYFILKYWIVSKKRLEFLALSYFFFKQKYGQWHDERKLTCNLFFLRGLWKNGTTSTSTGTATIKFMAGHFSGDSVDAYSLTKGWVHSNFVED